MTINQEKSILRRSEIKNIHRAAYIITNEILDFTTVKALAQEVDLNSNKLQVGFQIEFSKTVHNYVHDHRMTLAATLLKNSKYSISEIVYKVGLSSKSYFSKVFKERYLVSPSHFRIKIMKSS